MATEMSAGPRPGRVPFVIKATVVMAVVVGLVVWVATGVTHIHRPPTHAQLNAARAALTEIMSAQVADDKRLTGLDEQGLNGSPTAIALTQQLINDDELAASRLRDRGWPGYSAQYVSGLARALVAQAGQLKAVGATAAVPEDDIQNNLVNALFQLGGP